MTRHPLIGAMIVIALSTAFGAAVAEAQVLYSQNFDGLTLMGSVNERLGPGKVTVPASEPGTASHPNAFSKTGPAGWEIDNTLGMFDGTTPPQTYSPSPTTGNAGVPGAGLPNYGVDEWEGWSFASKSFWITADDQNRSLFTSGSGIVAVADADEYFDLGDSDDPVNGGYYNSSMKTPSIPVAAGDFYQLTYDSSWRDEALDDAYGPNAALNNTNNQAAEILAVFDNGETRVIAGWNSDSASPAFKNDAPNEPGLTAAFLAPTGATSVRLHFNYANAANDWWWAVDNLKLDNASTSTQVWSENFEGVALGPSVNERVAFTTKQTVAEATPDTLSRPDSFTNVPPTGWSVDNSALPAAAQGRNDIGVYEWEGWSFATHAFWTFADRQQRELFTKCVGICAIADSDEWTDLGNPGAGGPMDTLLVSPAIDISGVAPGQLRLTFDSSWRDEDDQAAVITVDYNDGTGPHEVLRWESRDMVDDGVGGMIPNPFFHNDAPNESVSLLVNNPAGKSTAQFRFALLSSNNNWWWAIDNVQVSQIPEPSSFALAGLAMAALGAIRHGRRRS